MPGENYNLTCAIVLERRVYRNLSGIVMNHPSLNQENFAQPSLFKKTDSGNLLPFLTRGCLRLAFRKKPLLSIECERRNRLARESDGYRLSESLGRVSRDFFRLAGDVLEDPWHCSLLHDSVMDDSSYLTVFVSCCSRRKRQSHKGETILSICGPMQYLIRFCLS